MNAEQSDPQSPDRSRIMRLCLTMAKIINPPPKRNAAQWANESRILPPESPEPGPFRSDRTPYVYDIAEAFEDPGIGTIPIVMGSQMGKTELIFNMIGKRYDDGPYTPALYIGPTQKQVKSISKDRIEKMIKTTPSLWEKLEKGQRDGVTEKWIGGVRLGFGWAGSATELASHPAGFVLIDEYDRMDEDVNNEGDPYTLAKARTKNYPAGTVVIVSTPTVQDASPIMALYDDGVRLAWCWSCPDCSEWFIPKLELIRWPEGSTPNEARREARLACPSCGSMFDNSVKHKLNQGGKYLVIDKDDNGEYHISENQDVNGSTVGFWVSGLASPWQSFGEIAEMLLAAYRSKKPERIQAAINTYGGELYKVSGDAPDWQEVEQCRADYMPGALPSGVQIITLGADVQKDGIYYVIRGWGFNQESWLLLNGFIPGATEYDDVWILASRQLEQRFGSETPGISQAIINRGFIDSGYRPGDKLKRPENAIYLFCRRHSGFAFPTKGHDSQDRPIKASKIDVTVSGRIVKNGIQLWHLDTDFFKTWIYSRIRWPKGEPGGWHVHREIEPDYCKQIVSEELVVKASGRRIWVQRKKDNHYLDAEVNATAAAFSLQVHTLQPPPQSGSGGSQKPKPQNSSFIRKRKGLFD